MRSWVLILALSPVLAQAQIYRWTDEQGRVHFSQQPVAGATPVEVKPQVIERDAATLERERRSERYFDARRQENRQAAASAAAELAEREQECTVLEERLARLQLGGRYFRNNAEGERVYYSESEIEAARRQLATRIQQRCR
ncbi:DUF4124 domain-containing protein [Stutzerimonas balearica]|uniref:DUF4124 domain-containing protein n=1 Tax=Stutzerimonas balearica TaxID=74829 RepID=UPI003F776111